VGISNNFSVKTEFRLDDRIDLTNLGERPKQVKTHTHHTTQIGKNRVIHQAGPGRTGDAFDHGPHPQSPPKRKTDQPHSSFTLKKSSRKENRRRKGDLNLAQNGRQDGDRSSSVRGCVRDGWLYCRAHCHGTPTVREKRQRRRGRRDAHRTLQAPVR
jgi:hypothetical protein